MALRQTDRSLWSGVLCPEWSWGRSPHLRLADSEKATWGVKWAQNKNIKFQFTTVSNIVAQWYKEIKELLL